MQLISIFKCPIKPTLYNFFMLQKDQKLLKVSICPVISMVKSMKDTYDKGWLMISYDLW